METTKFKTLLGEIECREFYDIVGTSTEISGIEVFRDSERLGSMIGVSLPDDEDKKEVDKFLDTVEDWLIENDF